MNSSVCEFLRREVPDWDDELVAMARFKAFSGQRSDWEPKLFFWRDLILKVARHLGISVISLAEVKDNWFSRGGLTPLCLDHVLLEMYNNGDVLKLDDVMNSSGSRLYRLFKRVGNLIRMSTSTSQQIFGDKLVLRTLLQERATEVIKLLSESHWTSSSVVTMEKFKSICGGSDEAFLIINYLCGCGKAQYLSFKKMNFIEGLKISITSGVFSDVSSIDYDMLHLTWTTEKLHRQLDMIDQRCEKLKISALNSAKSKNKGAALRHIRLLKLNAETREKCTSLLNRVEEVLSVIENAESTKQVSEAIQIGARAMKENSVSIEEVHAHLQELDESVASQKQVEEALASMSLQNDDTEDEDIEEEFKRLEKELGDQIPHLQIAGATQDDSTKEVKSQKSVEELNETLSNLKLEVA